MKGRTRIIAKLVLGLAIAVALAASSAQAAGFIPGYTDFPNALRVADEQRSEFIPGYTDFPNWLRLAPPGTIRAAVPVRIPAADARVGSEFNWADAGVGAGVTAAAAILLVGGLSVTLRRRGRLAASS
jgi:hypothetical protein